MNLLQSEDGEDGHVPLQGREPPNFPSDPGTQPGNHSLYSAICIVKVMWNEREDKCGGSGAVFLPNEAVVLP